eukprot:TRINITY_DN18477_c0_g1_i1.p1 TRINITY_DN18477_c0_g1~~TRINITY_DN18477_c0_g1_i1.p1  ORF type:complete len:478 (-),score=136.09 TRINITY_DN18477_c0_g1_i1:172-1605(-)
MGAETVAQSHGGYDAVEAGDGSTREGAEVAGEASTKKGIAHSGSSVSAVVNLTNTILGAGMLGMPYAFSEAGLSLGLALLFISGIGASVGLFLLYRVALWVEEQHAAENSMSERSSLCRVEPSFFAAAKLTYPSLVLLIDGAIVVKCFGVGTSYLIVIGDLVPDILKAVWPDLSSSDWDWLLDRRLWISLAMAFPIIELVFLRRIDSLRFTSLLALGAVVYLVFIVLYFAIMPPEIDGAEPSFPNPSVQYSPIVSVTIFEVFPIFVFGYTCHQNLLPIFNELRDPVPSRMGRVIAFSVSTCTTVYLAVGILGYLTYGEYVTSNIINDYPDDVIVSFGRVAITALVIFSYPLQSFPLRSSLDKMVGELMVLWQRYVRGEPDADSFRLNHATLRYVLESLFVCATTYTVAMLFDDLGVVFGLVGATGSTTICYILPGLFYFGSKRGEPWDSLTALSLVMVCIGFTIMIVSVTFILIEAF